jgi:FkbM family methyltransferase
MRKKFINMLIKIIKSIVTHVGIENYIYNILRVGLVREINNLNILDCGTSHDLPYIKLKNGLIFHGYLPSDKEKYLHSKLKFNTRVLLKRECIKVAIDIVLRYTYPHSMPFIKIPYIKIMRYGFHPQHFNTIYDYKISDYNRKLLISKFKIRNGEIVVDVGANIGYGAIRLSQLVGDKGIVVAIEADPTAYNILKKNIQLNNIKNVKIINKAAYSRKKSMKFYTTNRQANSLVKGIVKEDKYKEVEADTIPNILSGLSIDKVDMLSFTINGAEVHALEGMKPYLMKNNSFRISMAGWYIVDGKLLSKLAKRKIEKYNFRTEIGPSNGFIAWKKG